MHPVIFALIWIGVIGLVVAALCANAADAMAEDERRKGLADRDAPSILRITRLGGIPTGRWMYILTVFTDWFTAYQSPYIRYLSLVARVGLIIGLLFPITIIAVYFKLDMALSP